MSDTWQDALNDSPAEAAASDNPLLSMIREQRARKLGRNTVDVEVPGYGGRLLLRLGPIDGRQLASILERRERSQNPERDFAVNADLLIAACREVLRRETRSGPLAVVVDDEDEPVRVDDRLARMLQLPETTRAREVLAYLFEAANVPEMAVGIVAARYLEWAEGSDEDVDEELLGES